MTPLSDALTAAQRSALAALEKAYVAEAVDAEQLREGLHSCGISDDIDISFLTHALDVLREWGVTAPTMSERVTSAKVEPASDKQWTLIRRLCQEKGVSAPETSLTKAEASLVIDQLQKIGNYEPLPNVPF